MTVKHPLLGHPLDYQPNQDQQLLLVGMGCFWGAERLFWQQPGVVVTAVGYAGGAADTATYAQVCGGQTGHAEVVRVVFDCQKTSLDNLLNLFWQRHDPTQGMRQGNDMGSQYRSLLSLYSAEDYQQALASRDHYQQQLTSAGYGAITTEISQHLPFYYAEDYHQQYLHKNPQGYCGLRGTGLECK